MANVVRVCKLQRHQSFLPLIVYEDRLQPTTAMSDTQAQEIRAHFSNIREVIVKEIAAATRTITAAVAWLTDPEIVEALLAAVRRRAIVQIAILDDHNNSRGVASFERLEALGGRVCWIPASARRAGSLHHKFCVLDSDVVITGSFNWTKTASRADENIVVVRGDKSIVQGFEDAFRILLDKYGHDAPIEVFDSRQLLQRLNAISNLVDLADHEAIQHQASKLESIRHIHGVEQLLEALRENRWAKVPQFINEIKARLTALILYEDPDIIFLRMEAMSLEAELIGVTVEQGEIEAQIYEYDRQHTALVGALVSEYLRLRAKLTQLVARRQNDDAFRNAEADAKAEYEKYQKALAEAEPPSSKLTDDEQRELKKLWRIAAMRFHPDRAPAELQSVAAGLFHQAREAEKNGDLTAMRRLMAHYDKQTPLRDKVRDVSQKAGLEKEIERLARDVATIARRVAGLRTSKTYLTISKLQSWDDHFKDLRNQLEAECAVLRERLVEVGDE